jgi:hypothetical protein
VKTTVAIIFMAVLLVGISCNLDLLKTDDDAQTPTVSEIHSNLQNSELSVGEIARFWVNASDPEGGVLNYRWEKSAGEFVSTPDLDTLTWRAPLKGGDCTIKVTVGNQAKSVSVSKIIRVISSLKPVVNIISPVSGAYVVQYDDVDIEAEAFHDNGITVVKLYLNEIYIGNFSEFQPNRYKYKLTLDTAAGVAEIKVLAQATTSTINADSINVSIEGVIPGKR